MLDPPGPSPFFGSACATSWSAWSLQAKPVGDGATYTLWTDSYACTVVAVSPSGKQVTLQRDKATITNLEAVRNGTEPPKYTYARWPCTPQAP